MQENFKIFLILLFLVEFGLSANYILIAHRLECFPHPTDLCKNTTCRTRPIKRDLTLLDVECYLTEVIDMLEIRVKMHYKFIEYRQFLVDIEENICDYLNNEKPTKLINIMLPQIIKASNLRSCPVKDNLIVKGMDINSDNNPFGLPAGQYRMDINVTSRGRLLLSTKLFLSAKPIGAAKHEME